MAKQTSSMAAEGEQAIVEAQGNGGYIWVFPDKVRIKHSGIRGALTIGVIKGDKELQIDQISAIQWREPGNLILGHIQFTLIGGSTDSRKGYKDENALQFQKSRVAAFREVKSTVERLMREARQAHSAPPAPAPMDVPDQLRKLAELRDAGILTAAEFDAKKADLLRRM
jgi:hypothetical protein